MEVWEHSLERFISPEPDNPFVDAGFTVNVDADIEDEDVAYIVWDPVDVSIAEGSSGFGVLRLAGRVDVDIELEYISQNGFEPREAIVGVDYTESSSVAFEIDGTNDESDGDGYRIALTTLPDNLVESDEEFRLRVVGIESPNVVVPPGEPTSADRLIFLSSLDVGEEPTLWTDPSASDYATLSANTSANIVKTFEIIDDDAVDITVVCSYRQK